MQYNATHSLWDGSSEIKLKTYDLQFDIHIAVLNNGAQPGMIVDFRLSFLSERFSVALYPVYIIDPEKWKTLRKRHGKFAATPYDLEKKIALSSWGGLMIPRGGSDSVHLMFAEDVAGLRELPNGIFRVLLEYSSDSNLPWRLIREYTFEFQEFHRGELSKGESFQLANSGADRSRPIEWKDEDKLLLEEVVDNALNPNADEE